MEIQSSLEIVHKNLSSNTIILKRGHAISFLFKDKLCDQDFFLKSGNSFLKEKDLIPIIRDQNLPEQVLLGIFLALSQEKFRTLLNEAWPSLTPMDHEKLTKILTLEPKLPLPPILKPEIVHEKVQVKNRYNLEYTVCPENLTDRDFNKIVKRSTNDIAILHNVLRNMSSKKFAGLIERVRSSEKMGKYKLNEKQFEKLINALYYNPPKEESEKYSTIN